MVPAYGSVLNLGGHQPCFSLQFSWAETSTDLESDCYNFGQQFHSATTFKHVIGTLISFLLLLYFIVKVLIFNIFSQKTIVTFCISKGKLWYNVSHPCV